MQRITHSLLLALAAVCAGCSSEAAPDKKPPSANGSLEKYWLAEAPAAAKDVKAVKAAAADGGEVIAVGRVQDYTKGRAQFTLADKALVPCNEREGDTCKTPWDYCCEPKEALQAGMISVELRDGGKLRQEPIAGFHGLDRLKEVVVKGRIERDDSGNVVIVAEGIHVPSKG